ncbi:uroporphyrinogen decarboxylase family protein [Atrimonas thermophila]|uniref:uroporphyrinogen decarboxylase family protein n=1 Tax=Atrimonas thermophila TaxID=3064161 RepID=UPI00399C8224
MNKRDLYETRLKRYVKAMRNEKPDMVPIRPFVAEFTAKYAGFSIQEATHDYRVAFEACRICARDFDWDAMVPNMIYVWTGLTQAMGVTYYGIPGIDIPPETGFQYREPPEEEAFMKPEEYDALIEDPTGYLLNVWFPRVSRFVKAPGEPIDERHNLAFLRGGMAMMQYFQALSDLAREFREELGIVPAISGILKAPLDILADKLRGYYGLVTDLHERPQKVLKACEALMPHLLEVALSGADPEKNLPITIWMHRSCVPFINPEHFSNIFWPTLKPILEEIWKRGHQVLFYAEGNWDYHLETFRELPPGSIIYHVDRGDIFKVHQVLGDRFCISGGVPNDLLAFGSPEEVRACVKKIIDNVARDGGYIMDASAIIQNDAKIENIKAMTDFTREYGQY